MKTCLFNFEPNYYSTSSALKLPQHPSPDYMIIDCVLLESQDTRIPSIGGLGFKKRMTPCVYPTYRYIYQYWNTRTLRLCNKISFIYPRRKNKKNNQVMVLRPQPTWKIPGLHLRSCQVSCTLGWQGDSNLNTPVRNFHIEDCI